MNVRWHFFAHFGTGRIQSMTPSALNRPRPSVSDSRSTIGTARYSPPHAPSVATLCTSEDLSAGQDYDGLRVINPFLEEWAAP